MLDALLKIIDRLISLRQLHTSRRKELFKEVLDPVFNELLLVHGDYLAMFEKIERETQQLVKRDKNPKQGLKHIRNILKEKRIQYEPVRIKLKEFANALEKENLHKEEIDFIHAVIWYFPKGSLRIRITSSTVMVNAIDAYLSDMSEEMKYLDDSRKLFDLENKIRNTINEQKDTWSEVCEKYAILKICVTSL